MAADSLGAGRVGDLMFAIAQQYIPQVRLVWDEAILETQRMLWRTLPLVAEPGGAAALAALFSEAY